ncbi:hypothetical protein AYJ58_04870 [Shewanella sp. Pdp11]|uniref:DUF2845 domain-containing protein n=1 Tax=Shewanella sp. Pdp11 TaxID=2059264 RepID=UPI000CA1D2C2|nr:DUF2845 domain-containing protein [Shewanella sp. Pdp11]AUD58861.1 hypothetical protein AYJ58_04870 [Shewanella sp. Pdp11]
MKYLSLLSPVLLPMGLILISVSLSANAGGAMHCKQQVVNTGDTLTTVLEKCGSPSNIRQYSLPATYINSDGDRVIDPSKLPTEYQEWTYDFGPTRLMRRLYATDNKVTKIESLGYGH